MNRNILLTLVIFLGIISNGFPGHAVVNLKVTKGVVEPIRIAIADFQGSDAPLEQFGKEVSSIIANDLAGSGLFSPLDKKGFLDRTPTMGTQPKFPEWRILKAQALLVGRILKDGGKTYRAEFALYDIASERLLGKVAFTHSKIRRIAHKIADYVFTHLTGEQGYFDTQIVYVTEKAFGKKISKQLVLMDQDGKNAHALTYGQSLVMTPRFAPQGRLICYLDFGSDMRHPNVYLLNPDTNKKTLVGHFKGMTFAPRFSPDAHTLVMSLSKDGNSSLYAYDLKRKTHRRLTTGNAIDTSPSYAPDGRHIVFNSNRGGQTQLYVMESDGQNIKRISFGEGSYRTPVWSPRGDLIAFIKLWRGSFYLGVMKPDGSDERLITQGYILDDPMWSANGRMILYSRQERRGRFGLNIVDLTGSNDRSIPTLQVSYSGAWSAPLP